MEHSGDWQMRTRSTRPALTLRRHSATDQKETVSLDQFLLPSSLLQSSWSTSQDKRTPLVPNEQQATDAKHTLYEPAPAFKAGEIQTRSL